MPETNDYPSKYDPKREAQVPSMRTSVLRIAGAVVVSALMASANPTYATPISFERKFANCTELNKVYPGGVAKNSKVTNKGGATKNTPAVKPAIYKKNVSKDRDKDGIACEK
jgi:hypothetical protein